MRGDHDTLEIFLEIRLIAFTNRSKVKFQREKYIGFKEEIGLEIVGDGAGRERGFAASRERFHLCGVVAPEFVANFPQISLNGCHDCTTIGPRSRRDRATIAIFQGNLPKIGEMIPPCRNHDRGSIAPRSRFDRTAIVVFFHSSSMPSDWNLTLEISSEKRRTSAVAWSLDRDRAV